MPVVDAHTHVFCWGERPQDGFMSPTTQRTFLSQLLLRVTHLKREPGETLSAKMRNMLLRHLRESSLDYAVVLAQDAIYRQDGTRDDFETRFYVSNDYVLALARECPKVIPGASINPWRSDALKELDRCREAGARLVKIHTAIQGVDPSLSRFDPFYRHTAELGMVLMFHTGYARGCRALSQKVTDPELLARPLDHGLPVIAAHSGTCAPYDVEDYYPNFVRMMGRYPNMYGDTAVLATVVRLFSLRRLSREPESLRSRIIHGSDYPFPPARFAYALRIGLFPPKRHNPLELALQIKRTYDFGPQYESQVCDLLKVQWRSANDA